jgi:hypothetical protein
VDNLILQLAFINKSVQLFFSIIKTMQLKINRYFYDYLTRFVWPSGNACIQLVQKTLTQLFDTFSYFVEKPSNY